MQSGNNLMNISQFTYKDLDIDLIYRGGYLAYSFNYKGETYGARVKVISKKTLDVASLAFQLGVNVIETYEDIRLREGATEDRPETSNSRKPKPTRTKQRKT